MTRNQEIGICLLATITAVICLSLAFMMHNYKPNAPKQQIIVFEDNKIEPLDGILLIIKSSSNDTIVVGRASVDDCIRSLEENGKG